MKPYKMKAPNCALFSVAHVVCYIFPWKIVYNIVPEILLRIRCNKPFKVPLREILHAGVVSRQI